MIKYPILDIINNPDDLRHLEEKQLLQLAEELRQYLLETLNICGGHMAASFGAVELTIVLHYLFDTPKDRVIWDVGHQAYPHKILTGRKSLLHTIKHTNGLAPFPKREESPYDAFGVGHSSTSISAAVGMAIAAKQQGINRQIVAVIGDGAMTAGMAFEALNHAGALDSNILIILNDNEMSISENVGALSNYFARILTSKAYTSMREGSKKILKMMPPIKKFAKRTEEHLKGMIIPGTLFEELGVNYFGPIDGHDINLLIKTITNIKDLEGPKLLHVITKKGNGYAPAEQDPIGYHAVKPGFLTKTEKNKATSASGTKANNNKKTTAVTYSQVFGQWVCDMAEQDTRLTAITPAMREGSDLVRFSKEYAERYYDVGIAEQHSVTLAAGMACEGLKPVVAIYSTFLQRAYDQLIHDVAIQNLSVLFAIDRGGLVGGDGATHNGSFDLTYLRCIPNMVVMAPSNGNECRQMLYTGFMCDGPAAVRYPRGQVCNDTMGKGIENNMTALPLGKGEIIRQGKEIAILAFGASVNPAFSVAENLNATVVNMRFVKPLDVELIARMTNEYKYIITVEENVIAGGAGSGVNEVINNLSSSESIHGNINIPKIINLGFPDHFIEHGDPKELLIQCGLDADGIKRSIEKMLVNCSNNVTVNDI